MTRPPVRLREVLKAHVVPVLPTPRSEGDRIAGPDELGAQLLGITATSSSNPPTTASRHTSTTTAGSATGTSTSSGGPEVVLRWSGNRPVVVLSGDIDLLTAAQIAAVARLLHTCAGSTDQVRRFQPAVVDAAAVEFIDLAGLAAVQSLAGAHGTVEVRSPSRLVLALLEVLDRARLGIRAQLTAAPTPAVALLAPRSGRAGHR